MTGFGQIPKLELQTYFCIWICAVVYSVYCFAKASNKYFKTYNDVYGDFTEGWYFLPSRKKDKADFEWESLCYLLNSLYPWVFVYLIISEVCRQLKSGIKVLHHQYFQIVFSLIFVLVNYGYISLMVILLQPFIFKLFGNFHKKTAIWLCNIICLVLIAFYKQINTNELFLNYLNINEQEAYSVILSLGWINLRCTSYFLENTNANLPNLLSYCLYFPMLLTGPFILHKDFEKTAVDHLLLKMRLKRLALNILRCSFWMVFTNYCLHYIYVNATSFQPKLVTKLDCLGLCGYGYAMGQFFHIKYVVLYGLSTSFASFENIKVPNLPRCIGRIHLYSDMWKYFDPGLHSFLVRYIYLPVTKTNLTQNKLLPSLICFLFVFLWHGVENYIFVWALLNYLGISLEYMSENFNKKCLEKADFVKTMSPSCLRRIKCFLAAPLLAMSAVSNFYFFAGMEIGNIFFKRVLRGTLINYCLLISVLYCCCQVSTHLKKMNAHKM